MTDWTRLAALEDFPAGRGVRVDVGNDRLALFRIDDRIYAIGDRCSHAEASLAEGDVFGTEVECPKHGAAFDVATGDALTLPATQAVPTYETKIEDGAVFVRLEYV